MPKVNMKPVEGMLLIRINKDGEETKSGIVIAKKKELWQEDTLFAEVMAISEKEEKFKVGMILLIKGYDGKWLDPQYFDDSDAYLYRVIESHCAMAVIEQRPELEVHGG